MPEGPEIRRAADRLGRVLEGRRVTEVTLARDRYAALLDAAARLGGRRVRQVEPRGKAILTHFEGGITIYSHNQLYGEWAIFRGEPPASHLQTRLTIRTDSHCAVLYSASDIAILDTAAVPRHPYVARLGVELLDPSTRLADVLAQVCAAPFARRTLAALLLDQGFLAGIGNYLRSEILFVARLAPQWRPAELSAPQLAALARAALHLTRRSYRLRGITNVPDLARRLKARGWPYARYRHWVFDREGEACHRCGSPIRRVDIGGRGLFLCDHCQPCTDLTARSSCA